MSRQNRNVRTFVLPALALIASAGFAINGVQAAQTDAPRAGTTPVKVETLATGLKNPWAIDFLPDGRMLVTERPGNLRIISKDGNISKPIAGVPKVFARGQGGLLDVRLAPDFGETGTVYWSYAEPRDGGKAGTSVARGKLVLDGASAKLENVKVIYQQYPLVRTGFHFGSRIVFDKTGNLFVTTGDRGNMKDAAQDPSGSIGKVIRITPDGKPADGNPKKSGWAPEVWSIGHRNIQGAVLDTKTGELWTVEHGARGGDELNNPQPGLNYGWPVISYGREYSGAKIGIGTKKDGMEQPVYYWDPSIAASGMVLYSGDLFPEWKGNFLVGGLRGAQIARLIVEDGKVVAEEKLLAGEGDRFRDVRQGPDGAIYAVTDKSDGKLVRISPK